MERSQWLAERRKGIGGSDAAVAAGQSRWKTPLELYLEKIGEREDDPPNDAMYWGTLKEPLIRQEYCNRTGRSVTVPEGILAHREHPWCLASLDGITTDNRVFEAKTASSDYAWGEPGTDDVPFDYYLQVQHYMTVTGAPVADVAVLIGSSDFRIYEIPASAEAQAMLLDLEKAFWTCVENRTPPEPQNVEDLLVLHPKSLGNAVYADAEAIEAAQELHRVKKELEEREAEKERFELILKKKIGAADSLLWNGAPVATWKSCKDSVKFDAGRFAADHPELFKQYQKTVPGSRRFLLKPLKALKT